MNGSRLESAFACEDRRFEAMASNDLAQLDMLLADDLHYTHANGLVEGKTEFIRKLASDERKYLGAHLTERHGVERDGFVATYGVLSIVVRGKDEPVTIPQAYTGIYTETENGFQLFAWSGVKL